MLISDMINKFGYSEMYEWSKLFKFNIIPFARFVTFDKNEPDKITLANSDDDLIIGVTTINSACTSDNPDEWEGKYICNEYGDYLLQKIDENSLAPVINEYYDENKQYIKRSDRQEWIRVNILGKCIVEDNGKCLPGHYCTISDNGIAVPVYDNHKNKYYVIGRISDHTIIIFFK